MNFPFIIQIFSILVMKVSIAVYFPSVYRLFSPKAKVYLLDPVKVSMFFLSLCMLNNLMVRLFNGATTLFSYNKGIEYPFASLLVYVTLTAVTVTIFQTEKILLHEHARES